MSEWHASDLRERVAYVRGMAKGMNVDMKSKEGRLIHSILDVLKDVADTMDEVTCRQDDLEDYVTCMDEDLAKLEGVDNEDDWIELADSDVVTLADDAVDDDEDEVEEEVVLEVECPYCSDAFTLDPEAFDGHRIIHVTCPNCREILQVENDSAVGDGQRTSHIEDDDVGVDDGYPYQEP